MGKMSRGFNLIEVMIVVAVIGLLTAVALPAAQSYSARSKVSEAILVMSNCRTSISENFLSGAAVAPAADGWGCGENSTTSKYVSGLNTTADGVILVTLRNIGLGVDGRKITMIPMKSPAQPATAGDIGTPLHGWTCGGTGTTVIPNVLPSSCRGI